MADFINIIQHSGPSVYVLILLGVIGALLALAAMIVLGLSFGTKNRINPKLIYANLVVLFLLIVLTTGVGCVSYLHNIQLIHEALEQVPPTLKVE